jgi:hypothetical protein
MDRGPKAGYRGGALQSCKPAAIDETPGRLINSRAATTQNAQKQTPDPGTKKPAAEIRAGMARRQYFRNPTKWTSSSSGNVG